MSLARTVFIDHPTYVFTGTTLALSAAALGPTPSFGPLVLLLTNLRLYTRVVLPRPHAILKSIALLATVAFGVTLANASTAADALATTATSYSALILLGSISGVFALAVHLFDVKLNTRLGDGGRYVLFPALWATVWAVVGTGPAGRLFAWSPQYGADAYRWLRPILGPWGIDWVVAAWSVVLSEAIGTWVMGAAPEDDSFSEDDQSALISFEREAGPSTSTPVQPPPVASSGARRTPALLMLGGALLALTIPSLQYPGLPLPVREDNIMPLSVGCVLPGPVTGGHPPGLDDFIVESRTLNKARVLIWPEGSVRWDNDKERNDTLARVQRDVIGTDPGRFVGIGFEQSVGTNSRYERHLRYNGFLLLGKAGVVHEYHKRTLVPIAESFSMVASNEHPNITTLAWPYAESRRKRTFRDIPVTSSICLDFATASPFHALHSRPALVLAPARTWNVGAGRAMWNHARARAEEIHAPVLWCDGGEGGVSGITDAQRGEPLRVGQGSWEAEVGVRWPLNETRTVYAWGGDWMGLLFVWALVGAGSVAEGIVVMIQDVRSRDETDGWSTAISSRIKSIAGQLNERGRALMPKPRGEQQPLLHDA